MGYYNPIILWLLHFFLSFILAIEGLGGIIRKATEDLRFWFNWKYKQNYITYICFADDLMVLYHADIDLVRILWRALDAFVRLSGLAINQDKSFVYLLGVDDGLKIAFQDHLGLRLRALLVKYLSVLLITTILTHNDYIPLVEQIIFMIKLWTLTFLVYAGCLKLIKSVLFFHSGILVYYVYLTLLYY